MSLTKWNSELKDLFKSTKARFPNQGFEPETIKALLEDWSDWLGEVGWNRFQQGVKRARTTTDFFPTINLIRRLTPETEQRGSFSQEEFNDLVRRKRAGEKFYSLVDVVIECVRRVEKGEIKGHDERGQKNLELWAKKVRGSEKEYAAKMLAQSDRKRQKSDFQSVGGETDGAF